MALKAILETLDDVPEGLRELYTEKDGKFVLDVDVDEHPGVGELRRALERQKADRAKAQDQLKALRGEMDKFSGLDLDEIEAMRQKLEAMENEDHGIDDAKLGGLVEKRFGRVRKDLEAQLAAKDGRISELEQSAKDLTGQISEHKVFGAIRQAALDGGARKKALTDIINRARDVWRLEEGEPRAFDGDDPLMGKSGALTMGEWVERLTDDAPYLFEESRGAGAQGGEVAGQAGVKVVSPEQAGDNIADIAAGTVRIAS